MLQILCASLLVTLPGMCSWDDITKQGLNLRFKLMNHSCVMQWKGWRLPKWYEKQTSPNLKTDSKITKCVQDWHSFPFLKCQTPFYGYFEYSTHHLRPYPSSVLERGQMCVPINLKAPIFNISNIYQQSSSEVSVHTGVHGHAGSQAKLPWVPHLGW